MEAMADKYSLNLPNSVGGIKSTSYKIVILTGSTGVLGSMLLENLISDNTVTRIYALNRAHKKHSLDTRQRAAFREKGLDPNLLDSEKVKLLVADLLKSDDFGLPSKDFREMKASVTHVVHNAWPVVLTSPLSAFEASLEGMQNLLGFCMTSGALFSFIGTGFVLFNGDPGEKFLERPIPAHYALGSGYTESKWIAEQMTTKAREIGLRTQIIRVGQLCGPKANGAWRRQEWLPAIIQGSELLGCIPIIDGLVAWMHPEDASRAILESLDTGDRFPILHLRHPHPIPWSAIANVISSALQVEAIPLLEWLAKLREAQSIADSNQQGRKSYAHRLVPLYQHVAETWVTQGSEQREAFGLALMDIGQGLRACPSLSKMRRLNETDVKAWLTHWAQKPVMARL
ncbi:hypothetical protein V5O48_009493 [Marasmius crinis-equi]|uniref:Thioester reductase (TE) domain-containing protein n=1 Tax=Marasmius crinis-equi TaxID=585013 RepID=A0ABR3FB32_9AGAR